MGKIIMLSKGNILIAVSVSIIILFSFLGYIEVIKQQYYITNNFREFIKFNKESDSHKIQGIYAFRFLDQFFYWRLNGLYKVNLTKNSVVEYNDKCSSDIKYLMKKYASNEGAHWYEYIQSGFTGISKFRTGSPIAIQLDEKGAIYISIYNYFIVGSTNSGRGIVCL